MHNKQFSINQSVKVKMMAGHSQPKRIGIKLAE